MLQSYVSDGTGPLILSVRNRVSFMSVKHFLFVAFICLSTIACSGETIQRGSRSKFMNLYDVASLPQSAHWATYIGDTEDKIYIEYRTLVHLTSMTNNNPKTIVYWFDKKEIPKSAIAKFRSLK